LKLCCQSSQLYRSQHTRLPNLTPNEINSPNIESPILGSSDAASDTDNSSKQSDDQTDAEDCSFFKNPDHIPGKYWDTWVHLEIPPSPVLGREMSRAEQLRDSINSHEETMEESIDLDPSIENEQYIIPFWILRSENVRCRDCARETITDWINDEDCVWTFTLETKVKVMALLSDKDTSI
jgi:hypothetical protein